MRLQSLMLGVEDGEDGAKVVRPTAYRLTFDDGEGQQSSAVYDGRCITQTLATSTDSTDAGTHRTCGPFNTEPLTSGLATFYAALGWGPPPTLAVVEHEGKWLVSVGHTLAVSVLDGVDHLSIDDAMRAVRSMYFGDAWAGAPAELWEACGVSRPAADAPRATGHAAYLRCVNRLPEDYDGPYESSSRAFLFGFAGEFTTGSSDDLSAGATATTVIAPPPSTTIVTSTTGEP
jgi:hypothetical protein